MNFSGVVQETFHNFVSMMCRCEIFSRWFSDVFCGLCFLFEKVHFCEYIFFSLPSSGLPWCNLLGCIEKINYSYAVSYRNSVFG